MAGYMSTNCTDPETDLRNFLAENAVNFDCTIKDQNGRCLPVSEAGIPPICKTPDRPNHHISLKVGPLGGDYSALYTRTTLTAALSNQDITVRLLISSDMSVRFQNYVSGSSKCYSGREATFCVKGSGPDRVLSIRCPGVIMAEVLEDILKIITKEYAARVDIRILFDYDHIGAIMGRNGDGINTVERETNCRVRVYQEFCPFSTERVIRIIGQLHEVIACIQSLHSICHNIPFKRLHVPYVPKPYSAPLEPYGGYAEHVKKYNNNSHNHETNTSPVGYPPF